jgi:hypothetical protein
MGGPGSGRKKGSKSITGKILISKQRKTPDINKTIAYNKAKKALDKARSMKMGPNKNEKVRKAQEMLDKVSKR